MRVTGIRELRSQMSLVFGEGEPVLVTRHGKVSGLFLPLGEPKRIPSDLRSELAELLGRHLESLLEAKGVTEEEIQADFDAHRARRRRRR